MLKAAVIGVGMIGGNHARVYNELKECTLVAVSDTNEVLAQQVAARLSVPYETDFRRLVEIYEPDLVSVAVPTANHYDVVMELLERGIHVLVEKPIAATLEQGRAMRDLAQQKNLYLAVGHIERFNPAIIELKKRLRAGELGKPFRVQSRRLGPFPARIRDVGVVIDLATHDVDLVRYVLDTDIVRVSAETAQGISTDREDMMDCVMRCSNGVIATLNINWLTPTKTRDLTVTGTQGMFHVNYLTQDLYFYANDMAPMTWDRMSILTGVDEGNMIRYKLPRQEPLKAELLDFVEAVHDQRPPLVQAEDGLRALQVVLTIVQSGIDGHTITLDV